MTITAMWSSAAFFGVPGGVEGIDGPAGVGPGEAPVAVGEAVVVGVGIAVWVGVEVGVDVAPGARWVHAPSAINSTMTPVQAVARRRSAMQQVPPVVDEPV